MTKLWTKLVVLAVALSAVAAAVVTMAPHCGG